VERRSKKPEHHVRKKNVLDKLPWQVDVMYLTVESVSEAQTSN
jgi:hypothetical protein